MDNVDLSRLLPEGEHRGQDDEETALLSEMREEARSYLESFKWCDEVLEVYSGGGVGGIVSVWLTHIKPLSAEVDEYLWVIVGDMPSAYLITEDIPTPKEALEVYIEYMDEWVAALANGEPTEDLYPIDTEMTAELGETLGSRMRFLEERILPHFDELIG